MQEAINIATPNLVNICIDSTDGIEKNGRMYCFYQEEPVYFRNSHELMKMMGSFDGCPELSPVISRTPNLQ